MCVAIYKPKGVKCPSLDTLKKCWDANPDGAGFCVPSSDDVLINKGFMSWETFIDGFSPYLTYTGDMFIHFRIATHGGINPGNCHPFPVSTNVDDLKTMVCHSKYAIVHNGVFPITPRRNDISDTMEFVIRLAETGNINSVGLLDGFIDPSKLAVMSSDGVKMLGNWTEIDGVYYSNTHWRIEYKPVGFNTCWNTLSSDTGNNDTEGDYIKVKYKDTNKCDLNNGVCPMCGSEVACGYEDDELFCDYCGIQYVGVPESITRGLYSVYNNGVEALVD